MRVAAAGNSFMHAQEEKSVCDMIRLNESGIQDSLLASEE